MNGSQNLIWSVKKFILVFTEKSEGSVHISLVSENIGSVKIVNINHINYREKMNEMVYLAVGLRLH